MARTQTHTSHSYDMFRGPISSSASSSMQKPLPPVDWAKSSTSAGWQVFNATSVTEAASKRAVATKKAKVAEMSAEDAAAWRAANIVSIVGDHHKCPPPMTSFASLEPYLGETIYNRVCGLGFDAPTPIQAQAWPVLLRGGDFVGIAKTGSGKTLAFGIPALAVIAALPPSPAPLALMLAPTRELAQQIEGELVKVLPSTVRAVCIYGGGGTKGSQLAALRNQRPNIVVATPGRLIDFLGMQRVSLAHVAFLVLDEADRMLDMGFEPQVRQICSQLRPERQTVMFSATWPKEVERLATTFMRDFVRMNVGSTELLANSDVEQHFIHISEGERWERLTKILEAHNHQRVLVFCKTKRNADYLERQLSRVGQRRAMAIHGDKDQQQREAVLRHFRADGRAILVATDVASRGLDVKNLDVVVNYEFPMQLEDYVHRVGRTGRAGAKGQSYTLLSLREDQFTPQTAAALLQVLERAQQEVPAFIRDHARRASGSRAMRPTAAMRGHHLHYQHSTRPSSARPAEAMAPKPFGLSSLAPPSVGHIRFREDDDGDDDGHRAKIRRVEN